MHWVNTQKSINAIHHINRKKKKSHVFMPIDTEKHLIQSIRKIYYNFFSVIKALRQLRTKGNFLNWKKSIYKKQHIINVIIHGRD